MMEMAKQDAGREQAMSEEGLENNADVYTAVPQYQRGVGSWTPTDTIHGCLKVPYIKSRSTISPPYSQIPKVDCMPE